MGYEETTNNEPKGEDLLAFTARIVTAHVGNNRVTGAELPNMIKTVHEALVRLSGPAPGTVPAVPIKKSVTRQYLICLEDGTMHRMIKRHLRTVHSMTPEEYRARWNLPVDYPMVAPAYAKTRSDLAKRIGLGKRPKAAARKSER